QASPDAGRHPRSDEWASLYGRVIPGDTLADQLGHINAWWDRDQRDLEARTTALWGSASAIETAVGALRGDSDWPDRFREATSPLRLPEGLSDSFVTGD